MCIFTWGTLLRAYPNIQFDFLTPIDGVIVKMDSLIACKVGRDSSQFMFTRLIQGHGLGLNFGISGPPFMAESTDFSNCGPPSKKHIHTHTQYISQLRHELPLSHYPYLPIWFNMKHPNFPKKNQMLE